MRGNRGWPSLSVETPAGRSNEAMGYNVDVTLNDGKRFHVGKISNGKFTFDVEVLRVFLCQPFSEQLTSDQRKRLVFFLDLHDVVGRFAIKWDPSLLRSQMTKEVCAYLEYLETLEESDADDSPLQWFGEDGERLTLKEILEYPVNEADESHYFLGKFLFSKYSNFF